MLYRSWEGMSSMRRSRGAFDAARQSLRLGRSAANGAAWLRPEHDRVLKHERWRHRAEGQGAARAMTAPGRRPPGRAVFPR
jgi:hypothetical protein